MVEEIDTAEYGRRSDWGDDDHHVNDRDRHVSDRDGCQYHLASRPWFVYKSQTS